MLTDRQIAKIMRQRYFVMREDGSFLSENSWGKGTRFAFVQRKPALLRLVTNPGAYVYDSVADSNLT